ncbi:hypothetical protein E2C01_042057 [Portunus trituberculatus]|uniref:Uncharacterized protein n=1 Tax=Portunus trituberculatus TaxID=210409 RepID=A0A5B7FSN5_PORTR|nr:hypothetical protein [Portunus trituberculatus]
MTHDSHPTGRQKLSPPVCYLCQGRPPSQEESVGLSLLFTLLLLLYLKNMGLHPRYERNQDTFSHPQPRPKRTTIQ